MFRLGGLAKVKCNTMNALGADWLPKAEKDADKDFGEREREGEGQSAGKAPCLQRCPVRSQPSLKNRRKVLFTSIEPRLCS